MPEIVDDGDDAGAVRRGLKRQAYRCGGCKMMTMMLGRLVADCRGRPTGAVAAGVGKICPSWLALTVAMTPEMVVVAKKRAPYRWPRFEAAGSSARWLQKSLK